jgi:Peptidyl-prolyl cis-trans isomerase (rotamase) - cyclophilin family
MKKLSFLCCCALVLLSCKPQSDVRIVEISTEFGNIQIQLYNETPIHRDNFVKLVQDSAFDGILFHRVIQNFMIQGGDPDSKNAEPGQMLGESSIGEDLPAEILPSLYHKRGVIAAAREGDVVNPERKSSASQFYLAQGIIYPTVDSLNKRIEIVNTGRKRSITQRFQRPYNDSLQALQSAGNTDLHAQLMLDITRRADSLYAIEQLVLSPAQVEAYTTLGGIPHLDGYYTVFGEIISGYEVVEKIAALETDKNNRPLQDIRMKIRLIQ